MYGPPFQPDGTWHRGECPAAFEDRTLMGASHLQRLHVEVTFRHACEGQPAPRRLCSNRRPVLMRYRCQQMPVGGHDLPSYLQLIPDASPCFVNPMLCPQVIRMCRSQMGRPQN